MIDSIYMGYFFSRVSVHDVREFVEKHHYSHSINGVKIGFCFAIYNSGRMVGAMVFGELSTTSWKKYAKSEHDVIELRRLVCLDECPRNTESWFVSKALKFIKRNSSYTTVISYADPRFGHVGYVYQACSWNYLGQTNTDTIFVTPEGREYHSRALRTKYKGQYKPFVVRLRRLQSDGQLRKITVPGKHIYSYNLVGKHICTKHDYPKLIEAESQNVEIAA